MTQRREYDAEVHGNIFEWIRDECERQRYWQGRSDKPVAKPVPVTLRSLRDRNHSRNAIARLQPQEARPKTPGENVFEVSKARKL